MRSRLARAITWSIPPVYLALVAIQLVLTTRNGTELGLDGTIAFVGVLGMVVVGVLIVTRYPRNAVGWILCVIPVAMALQVASNEYAIYGDVANKGAVPYPLHVFAMLGGLWTVLGLLTGDLKAKIVDLRASRQRLVSAQDAERRRLERDLHDGAQRQLVELKTGLHTARAIAEREQASKAGQILEQIEGDADDAVATLRELAHGIYPPLLAAEGLAGALAAQASKAAVPVTVEVDGVGRTNMTDRLDALNGNLEIASRRGIGATVTGSIPFAAAGRGGES